MGLFISKFGGVSLEDGAAVRRVGELVRSQPERQVLVVSALKGVTQALDAACEAAREGLLDWDQLRVRHRSVLRQLDLPGDSLDRLLLSLRALLAHMARTGEVRERERDHVLSFGERMSARIVAAHLRRNAQAAVAIDAFDLGLIHRPDLPAPEAMPPPERERLRTRLLDVEGVAVVTGFVAVDTLGDLTTLGPNGSDLTATWLAEALGAEEVHLWKAVGGIFTADPNMIPGAQPLEQLGWDDAAAMAREGADVLHPAAGEPARRARIPVRVRSVFQPGSPGTLVSGKVPERAGPVALATRGRIALLETRGGPDRSEAVMRSALEELGLRLEARGLQPHGLYVESAVATLVIPDPSGLDRILGGLLEPGIHVRRGLGSMALVGLGVEQDQHLSALLSRSGGEGSLLLPPRPGARARCLLVARERLGAVATGVHEQLFEA